MRILTRVLVSIVLLVLLSIGVVIVLLPRLVESEEVRKQVSEAGRAMTGRIVSFEQIEIGLLPPSLRIRGGRVEGDKPDALPLLEADRVDLRLSLLSLLSLAVVVDYLEIQGATVRLTRTSEGLRLPNPEDRLSQNRADSKPEESREKDNDLRVALREFHLHDARFEFTDKAVSPPVFWVLEDVRGGASGSLLNGRLNFEMDGILGSGGRLEVEGRLVGQETLVGRVVLADVDLSPAASYLPPDIDFLAGVLSGSIDVEGYALDVLRFDLELEQGKLDFADVSLRGIVRAKAELLGGLSVSEGTFELDATAAELRYGKVFHKAVGIPATAEGRLAGDRENGLRIEDTAIRIAPMEGRVSVGFQPSLHAQLNTEPFDLAQFVALLPGMAGVNLVGRASLQDFQYQAAPFILRGGISFHKVGLAGKGALPLYLQGNLRGVGSRLESDSLSVELGDQRIPLELTVDRLLDIPRFRVGFASEGLDSNSLLAALGKRPDVIEGPLSLAVDLVGIVGGEFEPAETIMGEVRFKIAPGKIRGVSLLENAMRRLGSIGETALLAGEAQGGRSIQRFYADTFEELSGDFELSSGRAKIRTLRLLYRDYAVALQGSIGLSDLSLDCSGDLTLLESVDGGSPGKLSSSGQRVLHISHIGGTVDAP